MAGPRKALLFERLFNHVFAKGNDSEHRNANNGGPHGSATAPFDYSHPDALTAIANSLDTAFYGIMLGAHSPLECELNPLEQRVVSQITSLMSASGTHADLVPRLPSIMPKIMRTLRDEESSTAELASYIGRDVVLVSEVIRLANSPYYRIARKIDSLERAICILGRSGIRQLVANAAFKPLIDMKTGHFTQLASGIVWALAERSAQLCDCVAKKQNADRFHAYLTGLVHNVGFTVALKIMDRVYDGSDALRSNTFRMLLIDQATILSLMIAQEWDFPQPVLKALESQIGVFDLNSAPPLARILYISGILAKLSILSQREEFARTTERLQRQLAPLITTAHTRCYAKLALETS